MSTCSYCGGNLTAGSQKCEYCGAPVINSAPQKSFNQAPNTNNSQGFNQAPTFNPTPTFNQNPNFNNTPGFNQAPSFNYAPDFNNSQSFNQAPMFNQAHVSNQSVDFSCRVCGAPVTPGAIKCPYCNSPVASQAQSQPMGYGQNQPMGYGQPNYGQPQGFNQGYNQSMNSQPQSGNKRNGLGMGATIAFSIIAILCAFFSPIPANLLGLSTIFASYTRYKTSKNIVPVIIAGIAEVIVVFVSLAYMGANGTLQ